MSNMKTCPQCAEQIRSEAKVCRFCGARQQGKTNWLWIAGVLTGLALLSSLNLPSILPTTSANPRSTESIVDAALASARIERLVKARLRDPDSASFKHLGGGCGLVNSRNGFGGMSGDQPFVVGTNDRVAMQQDDPAAFAVVWKQHCVAKFHAPPLSAG